MAGRVTFGAALRCGTRSCRGTISYMDAIPPTVLLMRRNLRDPVAAPIWPAGVGLVDFREGDLEAVSKPVFFRKMNSDHSIARRRCHGSGTASRRTLERSTAIVAAAPRLEKRRTSAGRRSVVSARVDLHSLERHAVQPVTSRGFRSQRRDRLATIPRLDSCRRLAAIAPAAAQWARSSRRDRPAASRGRFRIGSRHFWGRTRGRVP